MITIGSTVLSQGEANQKGGKRVVMQESGRVKAYIQYFQKEIDQFSAVLLFVIIVANLIDLTLNYALYPGWVNGMTLAISIIGAILLATSVTKMLSRSSAFVILAYLFTINISIPGFSDPDMAQFVTSEFTNLGACLAILIFVGLIGRRQHMIFLGILNISMLTALYLLYQNHITFDFINLVIFIATTVVLAMSLKKFDRAIQFQYEMHKENLDCKLQIEDFKLKEEKRRNSFLSMMGKHKEEFVDKLSKSLKGILLERDPQKKSKLIEEQIHACTVFEVYTDQIEFGQRIEDIDTGFYARLRDKCNELTEYEMHICSLLRYDMATKNIALQLNKEVETIKWYRKRIRRKLKLQDGERLGDYCKMI